MQQTLASVGHLERVGGAVWIFPSHGGQSTTLEMTQCGSKRWQSSSLRIYKAAGQDLNRDSCKILCMTVPGAVQVNVVPREIGLYSELSCSNEIVRVL